MGQGRRVPAVQAVKDAIIRQGPDSAAVKLALSAHAWLNGFRIGFVDRTIVIRRGRREMLVERDLYVQVPIMMETFDLFFNTMYPRTENGLEVLDFSVPGFHRYRRSGTAFHFPSIPEDDAMNAYTHWYMPKPGDVVWDAGAHAGATVYDLSVAVGDSGRVYAFEPDEVNFRYLERNIALHNLSNVITSKMALSGKTGPVQFQMDGTMNAGIRDFLSLRHGWRDEDN